MSLGERQQRRCGEVRTAVASVVAIAVGFVLAAPLLAPAEEPGGIRSFTAEELLPFSPRRARFLVRGPDRETREARWSRLPAPGDGGRWRTEAVGIQAALLERGEDGRIQILTHWDYEGGHRIEYEPPALLLPARLEPGVESRSVSKVAIYDLEGGSKKSGTCVHRVRLVDESVVETPAGTFHAVRVAVARSVDVLGADAQVTIELAFVPGRGEVLERTVQRVSFLGFGRTEERRSLELLSEGDSAGKD